MGPCEERTETKNASYCSMCSSEHPLMLGVKCSVNACANNNPQQSMSLPRLPQAARSKGAQTAVHHSESQGFSGSQLMTTLVLYVIPQVSSSYTCLLDTLFDHDYQTCAIAV